MEDRANGLTKHAQVLAIAGSTNSGKTTIADHLKTILGDDGKKIVQIVHQDDYYMLKEKVEKIIRPEGSVPSFYWDYDSPTSVDRTAFVEAVRMAKETADFVIVEGNMITELEEILAFCDQLIFLTMDKTTCLRRRITRSYDPPDEDGYFDGVAWPAYLSHHQRALQLARNDPRITFIDVSTTNDVATRENVLSIIEAFSNDFIRITSSPLNPDEAARYVTSPSCGGISIFVGTTRNTFEGKEVLRLEYECYDEMAYKELRKLCSELRKKHPSVEKLFVIHRLGLVPVEEASVIIATSSPHRKDAIEATEFAIDELKRTVPIWKKEVYANGECSWKANSDCCHGGKRHKKDAQVPKKPTVSAPTIFWRK